MYVANEWINEWVSEINEWKNEWIAECMRVQKKYFTKANLESSFNIDDISIIIKY